MNKKLILVVALFGCLLLPHLLPAQEAASLTGVVADKTGAVIPQALVKVTDTKTNATFVTVTNGVGSYTFTRLLPGPGYTVEVTKDGFQSVSITNIYLGVDATHTQNVQLQVGKVSEVVEVRGSGSQVTLNTTDASVSTTLPMELVHELPLAVRDNPLGLLAYSPGVTVSGGDDNTLSSRDGAITGARSDQSNYTLDGLDVNDFGTGQVGALVGNAPVDSIQEIRTETANPLSGEGRGSGAQVQLVTKGGTNTWHGSAYEYNRTAATEANDFFSNRRGIARAPLTRNQFGATLGGPAVRNKLFFFFNYAGRRDATADTVNTTVPLDSFRAGTVGYINNSQPSTICNRSSRRDTTPGCISEVLSSNTSFDPAGLGPDQGLLSYLNTRYPHANDLTGGDGINTGAFIWHAPAKLRSNEYVSRIDYNLSSKMKLFGRVTIFRLQAGDDVNFAGAELFPGDPAPSNKIVDTSRAFVIGHTWTISNNKVNQFNVGETRSVLDFPSLFNPTGTTQYTSVMGTAFGGSRLTLPYNGGASQRRTVPIPLYKDEFTYVHGTHNIQFGGTFKPITDTSTLVADFNNVTLGLGGNLTSLDPAAGQVPADICCQGFASGTALARWSEAYTFALGRIGLVGSSYENAHDLQPLAQGSGHTRKYRYYETELFAQDSWRARNDLTLTYGLRWSKYSVPYEINGFQTAPNIDFASMYKARLAAAQAGISGDGVVPTVQYVFSGKANHAPGLYKPSWKDFAPRLAFAYNPSVSGGLFGRLLGDRKTVIRGGAGIVDDHTILSAINFFGDQTSFVFGQTVPTVPSGDLNTDPRFSQVGGLGKLPALTPPQPSAVPFTPYLVNGTTNIFNGLIGNANELAVDSRYKTPYSETLTFGIQRELPWNLLVEAAYVGRMGHRLLSRSDAGQVVDFRDTASGAGFVQSFTDLSNQARNGQPIVGAPFWENVMNPTLLANFGGTCEDFGFASCAELVNDPTVAGALVPIGDMGDTAAALYAQGLLPANVGLDPQFSSQLYFGNKSYSNYQGLLTSLHKKFSHGLLFDFNYTYSHSIDNNSTPANNATGTGLTGGYGGFLCDAIQLGSCRGNSDFDITHLFSVDGLYDLPIGRGKALGSNMPGWLNEIVGGWQIAGLSRWNTGFAFTTISQAFPVSFNANSPSLFIGKRSDLKVHIHTDAGGQVQLFADPTKAINAFTGPIGLQGPTRNNLRGPRFFNTNLSLNKHFPIRERLQLEFRAEAYNVFNHTNFSLPTGGVADTTNVSTFGVITSTFAPRVMQFSLRLDF